MFWLLMYPFRGTTRPPKLKPNHPIRSFFTEFGSKRARHPIVAILISVTVAAILIYPFPFLYTNNFTNGASNLPHHVWTSAQPYGGSRDTRPDVVMRSVWVHGSYMKALQSDVLLSALKIQDTLIGSTIDFAPKRTPNTLSLEYDPFKDLTTDARDTLHAINGLTNSSWFFHSPLQYWSSSSERIAADQDIVGTVNAKSHQSTSVNTTLRHSIVFSGKRFEDHNLVAADALVITLIHMHDSPVGRQWERKIEELAVRNPGSWQIYPANGRSFFNTLYEFQFKSLSCIDEVLLALLAPCLLLFLGTNMWRFSALKSRGGLLLAAITQLVFSFLSSFTVCAVLKIDLSHVPWPAYSAIITAIGFGNIYNLISAMDGTKPTASKEVRIGQALGETGHIALATAAFNLSVAWLLTWISQGPAMSAFSAFAAIDTSLDFFYLLLFFTPILSIDVRRTELVDAISLTRSTRNKGTIGLSSSSRKQWIPQRFDSIQQLFIRLAGPLVILAVAVLAGSHLSSRESWTQAIRSLFGMWLSDAPIQEAAVSHLSVDINQARTPTAWLQMQDHETAHEVIQVVKPHANSIIARVYDPIVFVLNGSDRTRNNHGVRPFLPAAYDFAKHQFGMFVFSVVTTVVLVGLLTNYLLWNEPSETTEEEHADPPLLQVRTLSGGHKYDIMLLASSRDGILATVGLDKLIRIWSIRNGISGYIIRDPDTDVNPFPVLAIAIDRNSNWLAILSAKDRVLLWNILETRWGPSMPVEMKGRKPLSFCFTTNNTEFIDPIVIVRRNGLMTELHVDDHYSKEIQICRSPLVCVRQHFETPGKGSPESPPRLITSSKKGCVHIASQLDQGWVSNELRIPEPNNDKEIMSIVPLPVLGSFLAVRKYAVDLIDIDTLKVTHTFETQLMEQDSLRCFHSTRRRPQCGSVGLASLALAYTSTETSNAVLQSYLPSRDGDTICFRDPLTPGSKTCCLWRETVEERYEVANPGRWEALQDYLVGIRKKEKEVPVDGIPVHPVANTGLRHRMAGLVSEETSEEEAWEVWSISSRGLRASSPLFGPNEKGHLLVATLGPMERMGRKTVAVAMGNIVKVITVGKDDFEAESSNENSMFTGMAVANRRKRPVVGTRKKTV